MEPDIAILVCRFVHYSSVMILWGAFGFLAWLVPGDLAAITSSKLNYLRVFLVAAAVVTTAAALPIETAIIGDGWTDAFNLQTLHDVLIESSVGRAWQVQAIAAFLLLGSLFALGPNTDRLTALASGMLLSSSALTGHAAMNAGLEGLVHALIDVAHVLSAGAWIGGLVPLLIMLVRMDRSSAELATAIVRFSTAGHVIVAILIVTGVVNSVFILAGAQVDMTDAYQSLLAAKVALVAVMVTIAVINRYVFVVRLRRRKGAGPSPVLAATGVELILGLCVIALVSVFGTLEPV